MIKLDWRKFEIINEKYTDAFQTLCLHLFSRFVHSETIRADFNQVGLETEPVLYKGKFYGFQSKYFEKGMDYEQIKHSVVKALNHFHDLDIIKIYYNCNARISTSKTKKELDQYAKSFGVKLEWLGRESFELALNNKKNLDLCQLFFGMGRELEYFSDTIPIEKRAFLNSRGYMDLETVCSNYHFYNIDDLVNRLLGSKRISVIKGLPGTGKSVLLEKIFTILCGKDCNFYEQIKVITENKYIPMLIKLKYCSAIPLEQLIREKKWEYKINPENYSIVYLFDGLDEVSAEVAERIVSYSQELLVQKTTQKIIFTIRKASHNNVFLHGIIDGDDTYEISDLDESKITLFFRNKEDKLKIELLNMIKKENQTLLHDIKDILLLTLLYDTVENVSDTTNIYDLFLLKDMYCNRQGKLDDLDLPEPKNNSILEINKRIAYTMHSNRAVIISRKDFMDIFFSMFPRISYKSVNETANYMLDTYFENDISDEAYSYEHRRYQEFYYILCLYELYMKNPCNLRKEEVFTNNEFFRMFFLPYLEKRSERERNLISLIEVNLLKTYLGINPLWGADAPWYQYSDEFCYAVASQPEKIFYEIIEDDNMAIKGNAFIDFESIEKVLEYKSSLKIGIAPDPLEDQLRFALRSIVMYWKCGKKVFAQKLLQELKLGIDYIKDKYPMFEKYIGNAFFEEKYSVIFIQIILNEHGLKEILDDINKNEIREVISSKKTKYVEALESFYDIALRYNFDKFIEVMDDFTNENTEYFCHFIICVENLIYLKNKQITEKLNTLLKKTLTNTVGISMLKLYFRLETTQTEKLLIQKEFERLSNERWIDLYGFNKEYDKAAFLSFLFGKKCVSEQYAHDTRVLYQNLYCNYIRVLNNETSFGDMVSRFLIDQGNSNINRFENITYHITCIFVETIRNMDLGFAEKQNIIEILSEKAKKTVHIGLLLKSLKRKDEADIDKLLRRFIEFIVQYENEASTYLSDNIEKYFILSFLYSGLDTSKSISYIRKGLNNGVVRHGWRKDGIVDTYLLEALEIMWEKNYFEWDVLKSYTEAYFRMILVLNKITDENYRVGTLESLIDILLKNDFSLAQKIMGEIVSYKLYTNVIIYKFVEQMIKMGAGIEHITPWFEYFDIVNYNEESISMKLELLLSIYYNDWYSKDDKTNIKEKILYYMEEGWIVSPVDWKEQNYKNYLDFCKKEKIEVRLRLWRDNDKELSNDIEKNFCTKVINYKTKKSLQKLYEELSEKRIIIEDGINWEKLVDKTIEIDETPQRFIDYLEKCKFPYQTFYTANSMYLYMPVGYLLKKYGLSELLWNCIKRNGGYADFINLIKAYDYASNREMCSELFARFFGFCELLVFDEK